MPVVWGRCRRVESSASAGCVWLQVMVLSIVDLSTDLSPFETIETIDDVQLEKLCHIP